MSTPVRPFKNSSIKARSKSTYLTCKLTYSWTSAAAQLQGNESRLQQQARLITCFSNSKAFDNRLTVKAICYNKKANILKKGYEGKSDTLPWIGEAAQLHWNESRLQQKARLI